MARTRDILIFIVTVGFLLAAIAYTLGREQTLSLAAVFAEPVGGGVIAVVPGSTGPDRKGTTDRLKAKLAAGASLAVIQPSVEEVAEETDDPTDDRVESTQLLRQPCPGISDGLLVAQVWPFEGVTVISTEGARSVMVEDGEVSRTLLQLPQAPLKADSAACLDSEIIGVTPGGRLIFNTDAISYELTSSETLIGYARDGFPIYGRYEGSLDACGGYEHPGGYRYSLSDQNFMIGCFSGTPQPFFIP